MNNTTQFVLDHVLEEKIDKYIEEEKFTDANSILEQCFNYGGCDHDLLNKYGFVLYNLEDKYKALDMFYKAVKSNPFNDDAKNNYLELYIELGHGGLEGFSSEQIELYTELYTEFFGDIEADKFIDPNQLPLLFPKNKTRIQAYLGNNTALTQTKYGRKIIVNTRDLSLTPHIIADGNWEDWITDFFIRYIKLGMTTFDIGANIGWYTLLCGDLVGHRGKVYSFEAEPNTFRLLNSSVEINGFFDRVMVENLGVTEKSGKLEFYSYKYHQGSSTFHKSELTGQYKDDITTIEVDTVSLDEYCEKNSINKIHFMKIDAEGSEPQIIKGAERLLKNDCIETILMEYTDANLEAVNILTQHGYKMWALHTDSELYDVTLDYITKRKDWLTLFFSRKGTRYV